MSPGGWKSFTDLPHLLRLSRMLHALPSHMAYMGGGHTYSGPCPSQMICLAALTTAITNKILPALAGHDMLLRTEIDQPSFPARLGGISIPVLREQTELLAFRVVTQGHVDAIVPQGRTDIDSPTTQVLQSEAGACRARMAERLRNGKQKRYNKL